MSSIVKVVEVVAQSEKSFDDAVAQAVKEVSRTVNDITSVWVDNFSCKVRDQKIEEYRVNAKVSFVVKGQK